MVTFLEERAGFSSISTSDRARGIPEKLTDFEKECFSSLDSPVSR